jgi:adenylate kinase family enzyme
VRLVRHVLVLLVIGGLEGGVVRRVLVIGSPGSGKSWFADQLGSRLGLPVVHLDRLYHDPGMGFSADKPAWRRYVVDELLRRDCWVMDGHYPATLDARLRASDSVVYLDYPTHVCLARAVRRRIRPPQIRPDMPADWRERLSASLLRSIVCFRRHEAPRVRALLQRYGEGRDLVVLVGPDQARAFLSTLNGPL